MVTGSATEESVDDAVVRTTVVDRDAIEQSGARDVGEALEQEPQLQVERGVFGAGISLMGLDPTYTLVLVDGRRTNGRIGGTVDLERFTVEGLEQIEVVRGSSSVLYGSDALAGVVNLRTRRPKRRFETSARLSAGTQSTYDADGWVGSRLGKFALWGRGGVHHADGFDLDSDDVATTGDRRWQWNGGLGTRFTPHRRLSMGLEGDYSRFRSVGIDASGAGAVFDRTNLTETAGLAGDLEASREDSRLLIRASYTRFRDQFLQDQRGSDDLDQYQDTVDQLAQGTAQVDLRLGRHEFSAGVDVQFEALETGRLDPGAVSRQRLGLYAQDQWVLGGSGRPRFVLAPGVRLDLDSYFGIHPTPKVSALAQPHAGLDFRMSYGRAYRAPGFRQMFLAFANPTVGYRVGGNPSLEPETSWGSSADVTIRPLAWARDPSDALSITLSAFDNRLQDAIGIDLIGNELGTDQFSYINVGLATTRGGSVLARLQLGRYGQLSTSYTFMYTRDHETGDPLPGRPAHRGSAALQLQNPHPRWSTRGNVRLGVEGPRPFFADVQGSRQRRDAPAFAALDLRVAQDLTRFVSLFLGVDNVLNAGNPTTNPLRPRRFYAGVAARY